MSCVVGVWLVELPSSSIMYWKVPRLIVKKTNRLTQVVVFFRRHFLCGALLCNCSSAEREVCLHMYNGNVQQNPSCAASCHNDLSPVLAYDSFIAMQIQYLLAHLFSTAVLIGSMHRTLCSKLFVRRA